MKEFHDVSPEKLICMLHTRRLNILVALSAALFLLPALPLVNGTAQSTATLAVGNKGPVPTGHSFTIGVKVFHFSSLNAFDTFDISIVVDPNVLSATSITLGGADSSWTVFINCVDGIGTNCGLADGPGVAHIAATSSTGIPIFSVGGADIFSITYTALNGAPSTAITASSPLILSAGVTITPTIMNGLYG